MEDRIAKLRGIPNERIEKEGFGWYLLQDDYLINEAVLVKPYEVDQFTQIASAVYQDFEDAVEKLIAEESWKEFDLPEAMKEMIIDSWDKKHMHLIGRVDIAGGMDDVPAKVLEFNADTPTMLPETTIFQDFFRDEFYKGRWAVFNRLHVELVRGFKTLAKENPHLEPSIVVCSLGYEEDALNAEIIRRAAEEAGFKADYSDLEYLQFEDDGIYLEFQDGSEYRYDFMYKLVPWEFIMYEEPELMEILRDLQLNDYLYIINPAFSILMQNKAMLPYLSKNFPADYILRASFEPNDFTNQSFVEKVTYGRLGENVKIYDQAQKTVAEHPGEWGKFRKIFQAYTPLNRDENFEYYQPGIYIVDGLPAAISFRRGENLIIDDDVEFIPHFIEQT